MSWMHRYPARCLPLFLALWAVPAVAASLNRCEPSALRVGHTTEITLSGKDLGSRSHPPELWTSFPARSQWVAESRDNDDALERVTFRVTLARDEPLGVGAVRIHSALGVSNPLLILLDDLPTVAAAGSPLMAEAAQIDPPAAIEGRSPNLQTVFFKIQGKRGQRLAAEVAANRLNSGLDPILRLVDAGGTELAYADDDEGLGADCRIEHTFTSEAPCFLELRDVEYRHNLFYRIRLGDFPLIQSAFPPAVHPGDVAHLVFHTKTEPIEASVAIPEPWPAETFPVSARYPKAETAGMGMLAVSRQKLSAETEPNNTADTANRVLLPAVVNGRFELEGDKDWFEFAVDNGEWLTVRLHCHRFGSPVFPHLMLYKDDGKEVARAGENNAENETLRYRVPRGGTYRLMVQDLIQRGGPPFTYVLSVSTDQSPVVVQANFDKKMNNNRFLSVAGGAFPVNIKCVRNDFSAPVEFRARIAGQSCTVIDPVIPEGKDAGTITVRLPEGLPAESLAFLQIEGHIRSNLRAYVAPLSTAPYLSNTFANLRRPPEFLDGPIPVRIERSPFRFLPDPVTLVAGENKRVRIPIQRFAQFQPHPAVQVSWHKLPPGVDGGEAATIDPDRNDIEVELKTEKAKPGTFDAVRIRGVVRIGNQDVTILSDPVRFEITEKGS